MLAWGVPRLRDLPWRRSRDPWWILSSEVMLQQTQVHRVVPKYLAFIEAFPTPGACADASLGDVLRLWHGLGYPRRARNLHLAATLITERGSFPDTLDELLLLPGVGPYTARAILAFAFESDAAVVDTNVARVYARVVGRRLSTGEVQAVADASLPQGDSWVWNQAMIDLGATLCRPTAPSCAGCPARTFCSWRGGGADPAIGSAAVSVKQRRFEGSDRQARGRLMLALQAGPVERAAVATVVGRADEAAERLLGGLVREGLVVCDQTTVSLPG